MSNCLRYSSRKGKSTCFRIMFPYYTIHFNYKSEKPLHRGSSRHSHQSFCVYKFTVRILTHSIAYVSTIYIKSSKSNNHQGLTVIASTIETIKISMYIILILIKYNLSEKATLHEIIRDFTISNV